MFSTENLLYLTMAFQPTASHRKSSFIDTKVYIGSEKKPWHLEIARDCMGLGWITLDRPFPENGGNITKMPMIAINYDQTFCNWFPVQLTITGRKNRYLALKDIIQTAINSIKNTSIHICISRLAVFKEPTGAFKYCWEIIDGKEPAIIADCVGDPEYLLTEEFSRRRMLVPPIRIKKEERDIQKNRRKNVVLTE